MLKSEVVQGFLKSKTHQDLAAMYVKNMEVQVNVAKEHGNSVDTGKLGGKVSMSYTDGIDTWRPFRIPMKAMSEPEDNDGPMTYPFDKYVEGIGMTGWDWFNKVSRWVAFDFDAMIGHSDRHTNKLSDVELAVVQEVVSNLSYVTLRKSTSGKGLHLYIFLAEPVSTANHGEHAALARAILSGMSAQCNVNLAEKVDICGGVMWVWHRKMLGTDGLKLIKQGVPLTQVPLNWKDHLGVVTKRAKRATVPLDLGASEDLFLELSGQRAKVRLDAEHLALLSYLESNNLRCAWHSDNHMLISHTKHLERAHLALNLKGRFFTESLTGDHDDINCYLFPLRGGAWAVRRYGIGTKEHYFWTQDGKGWTRSYLNRELTFDDVARLYNAITLESGYQYILCSEGIEAMKLLGIEFTLPSWILHRPMKAKELRSENKVSLTVPKEVTDKPEQMPGWFIDKAFFKRIFNNPRSGVPSEILALGDFDSQVRHVVTEMGIDLGWMLSTNGTNWREEPLKHLNLMLKSQGMPPKEIDFVVGRCVSNPWVYVNKPFEPEYPGDRTWNRSKARFKISPSIEGESLSYPTWQKVLDHCGESLNSVIINNEWCKEHGITSGADYLKLWFACLVRHSDQPLPYLAFYGEQDTGKSTLHEAFCDIILAGGFMDGAVALESDSNFNGELQDTILCFLEEVDLRRKEVINKVKSLVTGQRITIHVKGLTPYLTPNYTHWIQCVNDRAFIPVFEGDKRITLFNVATLTQGQLIPKRDLWLLLTKEAPDFLAFILNVIIPDSRDRLMLPVIHSADKIAAERESMTQVDKFFADQVFYVDGGIERGQDVYDAYVVWNGPDELLSRNKFARAKPSRILSGRVGTAKNQDAYYGNMTLNPNLEPSVPWVTDGIWLRRKDATPRVLVRSNDKELDASNGPQDSLPAE